MKIRKLHLKNIGVFDDEEIEFKECPAKDKAEIHILTGENGTGKTTILQALVMLFSFEFYGKGENHEVLVVPQLWKNELIKKLLVSLEGKISFEVKHNGEWRKCIFDFNVFENLGHISTPNTFYNDCRIDKSLIYYSEVANLKQYQPFKEGIITEPIDFAAFAYSGYRRIKDEPIEIGKEIDENPLYQALDFIKDESSKFTVNQWLGRNLIDGALANSKNKLYEAKRFEEKIKFLEKIVIEIIGYEIRFEMHSSNKLVLIKNNQELDFDVLPDGLKSLISWIGDLLMRLDSLKWENDTPIFDREIILFLDEIEVHLHPAWQRKVLPVVQKLFKNAQIFVSTHSPFVVNSVDDAWVYKLKVDENGKAKVEEVIESENSNSITQVLREVFGIEQWFGLEVQNNFERFRELKRKIISNGADNVTENELLEKARSLADEPNDQLKQMIRKELEELSEIKKKPYKL